VAASFGSRGGTAAFANGVFGLGDRRRRRADLVDVRLPLGEDAGLVELGDDARLGLRAAKLSVRDRHADAGGGGEPDVHVLADLDHPAGDVARGRRVSRGITTGDQSEDDENLWSPHAFRGQQAAGHMRRISHLSERAAVARRRAGSQTLRWAGTGARGLAGAHREDA
jgi:hypothetical protein